MSGPRITAIVAHVLRATVPADWPLPTASFVSDGAVLLEVTTTDDLVGWGEPSPYGAPMPALLEALGEMASSIVGMTIDEFGAHLRRIPTEGSHRYGTLPRAAVVAGLTQASWDLRGKVAGRPLHELLATAMGVPGAVADTSVAAYASAGMFFEDAPDEAMVEEVLRLRSLGHRAYKLRPPTPRGAGSHFARAAAPPPFDVDALVGRIARVRAAVGPDLALMVDLGRRLPDVDAAARFADAVAPMDITFIEEPFAGTLDEHRELRNRTAVPLSGGEQFSDAEELGRWVDGGALDLVQPDAGLMPIDRIVEFVRHDPERASRSLIPHSWANPVCIAANTHVAVAAGALMVEANETFNPMRDALLVDPVVPWDGRLVLSARPGLGVEVDREALERYSS